MPDLSQSEIGKIVNVLGNALTAYATNSLPGMPRHWTIGSARPTVHQMVRLKAIGDVMVELPQHMDPGDVHDWFAKLNPELKCSPADAIRHLGFYEARMAARQVTAAYNLITRESAGAPGKLTRCGSRITIRGLFNLNFYFSCSGDPEPGPSFDLNRKKQKFKSRLLVARHTAVNTDNRRKNSSHVNSRWLFTLASNIFRLW